MGHMLINYAMVLHSEACFQAELRVYLLFMGSCFKAANVSLSPRRQDRYLAGVFGEVMKK